MVGSVGVMDWGAQEVHNAATHVTSAITSLSGYGGLLEGRVVAGVTFSWVSVHVDHHFDVFGYPGHYALLAAGDGQLNGM